MRRWLKRGALALLACMAALLLLAWWLLRGSLPTLEGTQSLPGLAAPASIARDADGTVTIDAASEADAVRALGYVHAQERYFEMDLLRRTAAGELAALFGPIAVDTDKRHRLHRMRARVAAHLPRMLEAAGASVALAIGVGALVGPAQVAGRLLEFGFLRHVSPLLSARLAALAHPLGVLVLMGLGGGASAAFAILHGAGNGILTIAKGTLPLMLFGAEAYGARQGWLMLPARVAQAVAPVAFGVALDRLGGQAAWLSGGLAATAFLALMWLSAPTLSLAAAKAAD